MGCPSASGARGTKAVIKAWQALERRRRNASSPSPRCGHRDQSVAGPRANGCPLLPGVRGGVGRRWQCRRGVAAGRAPRFAGVSGAAGSVAVAWRRGGLHGSRGCRVPLAVSPWRGGGAGSTVRGGVGCRWQCRRGVAAVRCYRGFAGVSGAAGSVAVAWRRGGLHGSRGCRVPLAVSPWRGGGAGSTVRGGVGCRWQCRRGVAAGRAPRFAGVSGAAGSVAVAWRRGGLHGSRGCRVPLAVSPWRGGCPLLPGVRGGVGCRWQCRRGVAAGRAPRFAGVSGAAGSVAVAWRRGGLHGSRGCRVPLAVSPWRGGGAGSTVHGAVGRHW